MAKAKKPGSSAAPAEAKKTAAPTKAAKPAKSEKAAAAPVAPPPPQIDTNLAAESAAKVIANRGPSEAPAASDAPAAPRPERQESAAFAKLKQGLNKPAGGIGSLLGAPPGQKKSNQPMFGGKQNFRNQTFGADVNRAGVPRRTGG